MPEKLKELLEKINEEGVKKGEEKANELVSKARLEAEKIIKDANLKAKAIIDKATIEANKTKESGELTLKQAHRDLILSLKEEIRNILKRIVKDELNKSLSIENLSVILEKLIESFLKDKQESKNIEILLKKDDLEKLKLSFFTKLRQKLTSGIEFKPSPNIDAGFSISFDKGKSYFDFTDEGLQEALSAYLNTELSKLLG
ncbi:MAG: hypothetical protein ABH848_03180 [Candidatus Omnitrophota bacterium]